MHLLKPQSWGTRADSQQFFTRFERALPANPPGNTSQLHNKILKIFNSMDLHFRHISFLQANAKQATIGKLVDDAMVAIERDNRSLEGVLPKDYARPALDKQRLEC